MVKLVRGHLGVSGMAKVALLAALTILALSVATCIAGLLLASFQAISAAGLAGMMLTSLAGIAFSISIISSVYAAAEHNIIIPIALALTSIIMADTIGLLTTRTFLVLAPAQVKIGSSLLASAGAVISIAVIMFIMRPWIEAGRR